MIWISRLFACILITSLTGTICTGVWYLLQKLIMKRDARLVYLCLKWNLLFYFIPTTYIAIIQTNKATWNNQGIITGELFFLTPTILKIVKICGIVWLAIAIAIFCIRFYSNLKWWTIQRGNITHHNEEMEKQVFDICKAVGIKRNIRLKWNDRIQTPVIIGIIHPTILLPMKNYSSKELGIICFHELTHYKKRDILVKAATIMVTTIHCFNPISYYMLKQIKRWSEAACDIDACERGKEYFTTKEYFGEILNNIIDSSNYGSYLLSAFFETRSEIERRIILMKFYRKKGEFKKAVTYLLVGFYFLGGSITSYAAGQGVTSLYTTVYEHTSVSYEETVTVNGGNTLTEYSIPAESKSIKELPNTFMDMDVLGVQSSTTLVDWTILANNKCTTSTFYVSKGGTIVIAFGVNPDDKNVKMGIIEPDGTQRYVQSSGTITHSFAVNVSGYHSFYIENPNSVSITAVGCYIR